ncbi:caspase-8-like isoform X2 [Sphaeramia orbicularis]|uniref:caspase-8-like isoform X2 n=1 Tax=Sphaeramia orbicularis TaxID=375764 RepID=UPI00117E5C06|nr:caspase-8-like isoform X2 [Sphaeramia orbicularis]
MSAKDTLRHNKTAIQLILSADQQLILDKVYEKELITEREYRIIKSINKDSSERTVIEIVDKIMEKGEARCRDFLDLLKTDEMIKETYPDLQGMELNYTLHPQRPSQESSSAGNRDDVAPESDGQNQQLNRITNLCLPMRNYPMEGNVRRGSDIDAANAEAITRPISVLDETEYYTLTHNPRGWCVIINIENFTGIQLKRRKGSQMDTVALTEVFTRLGFKVDVEKDLTADEIRTKVQNLGRENFVDHDALVVCVLSSGEEGVVYGSDECMVSLRDLRWPFAADRAPTLAGKPKLFFIQACQGDGYQRGALPCSPQPRQGEFSLPQPETTTQVTVAYASKEDKRQRLLEEDASVHVLCETLASEADFLMGMATLPGYKSFRNTTTGSVYIQELCRQLMRSAGSSEMDDILTILTRVNREVNKLNLLTYKQMPQPYYTLTKRLVLKFVC